jgi:Second Messenger Oligonucleotide or Dinucleotide Synthetase domain/Adenylyl/Guanylyl and SMODS C-terminal sensor domain
VKLHDYFAGLLADTVNLPQTSLDLLDTRVGSVVGAIETDPVLGPLFQQHIPQGSWPHRTIIRPLPGDEFDADFLMHLDEVPEWSDDPKEYLKQTRAAFRRSFGYRNMVQKKNRCVRLQYVNSCHVDVVPYLVLADGRQVIVNYADNQFEDTNPAGFTDWMTESDELSNGHLRRVLRLLKYLRDYKGTFSVPSVILTTLVGGRVQAWNSDKLYPDLPTALVRLLADLDQWLALRPTMPSLPDPSCPGTTFNHRWDQTRYANFAKWIAYYSAKAQAAYDEPDRDASVALWREIFGDAFAKSDSPAVAAETAAVAKSAALVERAPDEQFIDELGYRLLPAHTARIDATVRHRAGWRNGTLLRRVPATQKRMTVDFRLVTDCPEPFEVLWKVRNTGPEAAARGQLRGEILTDDGSRTRTEQTLYRGSHYVQAYVVRDGAVVATGHHEVRID